MTTNWKKKKHSQQVTSSYVIINKMIAIIIKKEEARVLFKNKCQTEWYLIKLYLKYNFIYSIIIKFD